MLIEIESVHGDKLLHGSHIDLAELKKVAADLFDEVREVDFSVVFCARMNYEEILYSDAKPDCVIDLDTHRVYVPSH